MKIMLVFIGGIFTGIIILVLIGILGTQLASNFMEERQAEWMPDFDAQLFKSATELAVAKTEYERWVALADVGLWNAVAGSSDKAEQFSLETLRIAKKYPNDWNYGNAIHKAHITLGMLKYQNGDTAGAKKELTLAGKTPGSPQLNSFGPNMILAKKILEEGEGEIVIEYFELCGKFWKMGKGKLKQWTSDVDDGRMPNFGANLIY